MRFHVLLSCLLPCALAQAQAPPKLAIAGKVTVHVDEPSDLCLRSGGEHPTFFVASDNGYVAAIDDQGRCLHKSGMIGFDFEACMLYQGRLVAVDEMARRVMWLDTATFGVERSLTVPYNGGRNKGYEAVAWNALKQRIVLITERDPVRILELDTAMHITNELPLNADVRDISSACFHDGSMWLLSDMEMRLMRCDPRTYAVLESWSLPIINPEGFAFGDDGRLWVVSDDRQVLYYFNLPKGS